MCLDRRTVCQPRPRLRGTGRLACGSSCTPAVQPPFRCWVVHPVVVAALLLLVLHWPDGSSEQPLGELAEGTQLVAQLDRRDAKCFLHVGFEDPAAWGLR